MLAPSPITLRWLIAVLFRFSMKFIQRSLLVISCTLFAWIVPGSTVVVDDWYRIAYRISDPAFDYIGWEVEAIRKKAEQTLFGYQAFMTEAERSQFVREYMADLTQAHILEGEINRIYIDPNISNPDVESADLRTERDSLRSDLAQRQLTAEAILEGQVATILVEEGFGTFGQLFPPMAMHFTQIPNLLIVSPRDEIRFDISLNVVPLPIDEIAQLETDIDFSEGVSSLIVPLGGIALYPAMIFETTSIPHAVEVFAHEWLHHYLYFYPLGWTYFSVGFAGDARTINETTADIFGKEVARLVLSRYYPDLLPSPPQPVDESNPVIVEPDPDGFDFGAIMNETRMTVDELLADGKVEEAEAYMETQRQLFVENGFGIRKLNQAYFAFYGGYQGGGIPGVAGEDPIGPAIHTIRENSPSLLQFVNTMQNITTLDILLEQAQSIP